MKKQAINFGWPVYLSDFTIDSTQENFSRSKLKVFYKGETADHRYFSDAFSQELIKSLPYTPVVSYYDEEKDDFVGHATKQQIFGIVDPCVTPAFEKDASGIEWCICDVVLYTERPDQLGELAKRIVGHKQSLELDPSSVKYTINYDSKRHFKNVEFTAGRFIGISVLGKDQKPAFTGSEFFSYDSTFEEKMNLLRNYCETKDDQKNSWGKEMKLQDFMKLSWGDISLKVEEALQHEYEEEAFIQIIDMFDDSVIVRFCSYLDNSCKLVRIKYSVIEDGCVILGDCNEVHVVYEDIPTEKCETPVNEEDIKKEVENENQPSDETEVIEITETTETTQKVDEENKNDEEIKEIKEVEDVEKEKETEDFNVTEIQPDVESTSDGIAEIAETPEKVSVTDDKQTQEQESGTSSFTCSEREISSDSNKEEKIQLINNYQEYLNKEELVDFTSNIEKYTVNELERELLKKYKNYQEKHSSKKVMRAFSLNSLKTNTSVDTLDSFVRTNLGK